VKEIKKKQNEREIENCERKERLKRGISRKDARVQK
jgi:hypothetical protein